MTLSIHIVSDDTPYICLPPVLFHSPLLVGLGLPESKHDASMVVLPGKSDAEGLVKLSGAWYRLDRAGKGKREETRELLSILHSREKKDVRLQQSFFHICQQLGIVLEPAILDLFFSIPDFDDALGVLLKIGRSGGGAKGRSLQELFAYFSEGEIGATQFAMWKERCEHRILGDTLHRLSLEIAALDFRMLTMKSNAELLGIQRSFIEFLGAIGSEVNPLEYLKHRFLFLGGKFVRTAGRGLIHVFPQTPLPNSVEEQLDWLVEEAQKGAMDVEKIWRSFTEPEQ
jgi:hypothetical protein